MGKIQEFTIKVNENPECYTVSPDGSMVVSGQVVLVLNEAVQVRRLKLRFLGMSQCRWSTGRRGHRTTHSSHDELWKDKVDLIRSDETAPAELHIGMHTIPFNFEIASSRHLPSSYNNHSCGKIYYELFAKMDRFGKVFDDKAAIPLTVWNPLRADLTSYMVPAEIDEEHTDCCLCCASGPVIVHATFNKSAFRLGSDDTIDISLSVTNMKHESIVPKAYIEEFSVYIAGSSSTRRTLKVLEVEGSPIMGRTRDNRVNLRLGPILQPVCGNVDSTLNVKVTYQIHIRMKGSRFALYHPIFIGLDHSYIPPAMVGQASGGAFIDPYPDRALPPPVDYSDVHLYQSKPAEFS